MELVSQTALQKGSKTRSSYNMALSSTKKVLVFRSLKNAATKVKVMFTLEQDTKEEKRCSFSLSLTSALDECGWSTPRHGLFTPRKGIRYQFYSRLGGPQGRPGRLQKIPPQPGLDPRTDQSVAIRYTGYALRAHTQQLMRRKSRFELLVKV